MFLHYLANYENTDIIASRLKLCAVLLTNTQTSSEVSSGNIQTTLVVKQTTVCNSHMTWSIQPSDMHTVGVHHVCDHDIKRHVNYGIHFRLTWKVNGHYRRDILLQYHKCQQPTNTQDVFCVLTKQYTAFKSTEVISVYQVLQGSAESLIG